MTPWRRGRVVSDVRIPLAILVLAALSSQAAAQSGSADARAVAPGDVIVERTAGFSWFSPGGSLGDVTDRRVYYTGIRRHSIRVTFGRFALGYMTELTPLMVVERTRPNNQVCWGGANQARICRIDRSDHLAAGAGASPLGAKLYFAPGGRWIAHASGAAGMALFSSEVPIYDSERINFTFDYGVGLEYRTPGGKAVTVGYRFHHISNAGIGLKNPGLDANVVYLGVAKARRRS